MIRMLQGTDKEDLEALWKIVKSKYNDIRPENEFERVLWGDLKVMFEPDKRSDVWRLLQGYRVTIWKLIDSFGVYFIRNLKIQKLNIKFRGGLLGLERLQGNLRLLLLKYYYADHMNAILGMYTELNEVTNLQCDYMEALEKCECLEKGLSKSITMSKSFEALQKHAINLELALQQYKDIAISELKKLIENMKGKYVETKFEKPSVIRQSNAFKSQRSFILGIYKVHTETSETRTPQLPQDIRKTNKRVSFSTGVIPTTSFSRPPLKSNRIEDRVMSNNSKGKKKETSNVNFVCVTYGKCVLNDNHDMCVLHYINGMNSRTRKPIVVPISTRELKQNMDQSVVTSHKKIVAIESIVKKPRSIIRKLYEQVSKACSLWYPKFIPSGYKWKPKSPIGNVNTNVSMPLGNASRTANILEPMTPRCSTMSNTPSSSNSFVAHRDNSIHRTMKFGNDQIAPIIDLKVAFWKSTCYIRDLKGNDLLTGSRGTDLYFITLQETSNPNPICLMAKATSSQAWLWHRHLSHLNFNTINLLLKNDIVIGLPKLKFVKDHLCSSCELGKSKQKSFHTKTTLSFKRRLQILHMDLCGPLRVESFNGTKHVLVIVDEYSRYTWTHFLRSKDEKPKVLIDFLRLVQRGLHAQVRTVQTEKGTKFLNKTLHVYFAKEGIRHKTSIARTPDKTALSKDGTVLLLRLLEQC
ncbi:retrovirus-related pol polyprotein from transposon TNT 1-94 [Tanacetum coccineum]